MPDANYFTNQRLADEAAVNAGDKSKLPELEHIYSKLSPEDMQRVHPGHGEASVMAKNAALFNHVHNVVGSLHDLASPEGQMAAGADAGSGGLASLLAGHLNDLADHIGSMTSMTTVPGTAPKPNGNPGRGKYKDTSPKSKYVDVADRRAADRKRAAGNKSYDYDVDGKKVSVTGDKGSPASRAKAKAAMKKKGAKVTPKAKQASKKDS